MFTNIGSRFFYHTCLYLFSSLIGLCLMLTLSCRPSPSLVILQRADHQVATTILKKINELNAQGKYAEAIPLAKQLLEVVEKEKGPDHAGVAACLDVLGGLYTSFGDYGKAEPILKRALENHEKLEGKESPNVATSLGLLAKVYIELGDYSSALPLANRALQIREKMLGSDHFMVSTSLNTLGEIYLDLHEFEKAEPLFLRAIAIRKKHENPHGLVISLNNLSRLYYETHDYDAAEPLAVVALDLGTASLGEDHPHLAETLNVLGRIYAATGKYEKSFDCLKRGQIIQLQSIDNMKGFTSEKQKLKYLAKMEEDLHVFLTLIANKLTQSYEAVKEGLNIVLKRKGIVLEVQKQFQRALVAGDERALEIFQRLSETRAILSKMAFSGPGVEDLQTYREKINSLRSEKEQLEIILSTLSNPYTRYLKKAEANCNTIAEALPNHSVLIEFFRIRMFNLEAYAKKKWNRSRYFAFILPAGNPDGVQLVDLGDIEKIDDCIVSFKKSLTHPRTPNPEKAQMLAFQLYRHAFAPLEKGLGKTRKIFLCPDGNLNLIPFEVFRQPNAHFLVEKFIFNYLTSGRDMLGFGGESLHSSKPVVMGNPDFDLGLEDRHETLAKIALQGEQDFSTRYSRDLRGLRFKPLPGTEKEVQLISDILGEDNIELFTGKQALEEVLVKTESPIFLHLATHGFFLADQDMRWVMRNHFDRGITVHHPKPTQFIEIENPLLRSGVALAGANRFLEYGGRAGGIVTAEEILGLKLHGTDMVVLSACETGLGAVKIGEGVFGLRRAFTQAGVKSLIMSMWPVPDQETSELMAEFYRNIISGKMNRAQALRQAILRQIQIVRDRYGNTNPLYWGGFVFLGEP